MSNSIISTKAPRGARKAEQETAKAAGLKTFISAWPCPHGHNEFSVSTGKCAACARLSVRKWQQENPEKAAENSRKWQQENPERKAERNRKWYEENLERKAERNRKWQQENPEKVAANTRKWQQANPEKVVANSRKWYGANPEIVFIRSCLKRLNDDRNHETNYEALLGYTASDLNTHIASQFSEGMSWDDRQTFHIDHILPVSWFIKQGITDPKIVNALVNLRPMVPSENLSKGAKWDNEEHGQMTFLSIITKAVYGMTASQYLETIRKEVA